MKRRIGSSPRSRPPPKKRLPQTPDTLLPNPSSSDSSEPSVASSSGKMSCTFLKDRRWSIASDAFLLKELIKAKKQEDGYIGLLWSDERMWEKIQVKVNSEAPMLRRLGEIQNRVDKYKRAYHKHGDHMLIEDTEIRLLVKDLFNKRVEISSPTVPRNRSLSRSRTNSCSRQLSTGASTVNGGGNTSQSHDNALFVAVTSLDEVKRRGDEFIADCMFHLVSKSLDKTFLSLANDAQKWRFLENLLS